jgi:hypothetical protein
LCFFPLTSLCRQQPSNADKEAFDQVKTSPPSAETHPHTFAWFVLIQRFHESVRNSWAAPAGAAPKGGKGAKAETKKEEPKKEAADDFDPFADDGEDDEVTI